MKEENITLTLKPSAVAPPKIDEPKKVPVFPPPSLHLPSSLFIFLFFHVHIVFQVEPPKEEPKKVEPVKVDPPKAEPPKPEPVAVVDPPKPQPVAVVEPPKPDPPKVETPKVEPKKEEKTVSEENITLTLKPSAVASPKKVDSPKVEPKVLRSFPSFEISSLPSSLPLHLPFAILENIDFPYAFLFAVYYIIYNHRFL